MPISLCGAAVVLSLNGLILLGGQERLKTNDSKTQTNDILSLRTSDLMLEVVVNSNESMEWRILPQKLDRPRKHPIALLIADEFTHCSNFGKVTKSSIMFIPTKFVIFLAILLVGTSSISLKFAFIFCKGPLINNSESDEIENHISENNLAVTLPRSASCINNFFLEENLEYEKTSSKMMDICIIPSSQIQMKTQIGTLLFSVFVTIICII